MPLPLPHPNDIMLSQPHDSNPAISAAGLGSSLPQPLTKFDPGPSDQPSNIMRGTVTPCPTSPKILITGLLHPRLGLRIHLGSYPFGGLWNIRMRSWGSTTPPLPLIHFVDVTYDGFSRSS